MNILKKTIVFFSFWMLVFYPNMHAGKLTIKNETDWDVDFSLQRKIGGAITQGLKGQEEMSGQIESEDAFNYIRVVTRDDKGQIIVQQDNVLYIPITDEDIIFHIKTTGVVKCDDAECTSSKDIINF